MKQDFIDGIYNYCDRWCERCAFTSRCRSYERSDKLSPGQRDISNKAFWDHIAADFEKAMVMLHKMAKEKGIDLNNISAEEAKKYEQKREAIESAAKQHILSLLCRQYREAVMPFFKKEVSRELVNKTKELVRHLHIGIRTEEEIVHTMADLGDCEEVIDWYLSFIDAKLQRALHGKMEADEDSRFQKDSDGSAKIVIVAIERSIGAWTRFYELMPSSEDVALEALSLLSRLKQQTLKEFPGAMHFRRPGFDEE